MTSTATDVSAILHAIATLAKRFDTDLQAVAVEENLSPTLAGVLASLARGGETKMSVLSRALECDAGNLSGNIDRLEEAKLVARKVSASDRRVRLISLTAEGRRRAIKLERRLGGSAVVRALRQLDESDLAKFGSLLETLLSNAK